MHTGMSESVSLRHLIGQYEPVALQALGDARMLMSTNPGQALAYYMIALQTDSSIKVANTTMIFYLTAQ